MSNNESAEDESREEKSGFRFIAKAGGVFAALTSFVSDILNPIFEFTLVFLILSAIFVVGALVLYLLGKSWKPAEELNEKLAIRTHDLWFRYYFGAGVLAMIIFAGVYALNDDTEEGFLAEHVEFFRALQDDLGIVNKHLIDIERHSAEAAKHSKETATHTRIMATEQKKAAEYLKEIANPTDARRALVSFGFHANAEDYAMKLNEGDVAMVGLFHKAGVQPNVLNGDGNSPLFGAIMLSAPNILEILDSALESGQLNSDERLQPEMESLARRGYFDSFNEWLAGNDKLFKTMGINKSTRLKDLNLGSSLALAEFLPSSQTLDFIARHKLNMSQAIKLREAIAENYENYINDYQNWLDGLKKLDSSIYSTLKTMRDTKKIPDNKRLEEMLHNDMERRIWFTSPDHPSFDKFATTPFKDLDEALRICVENRSGEECYNSLNQMIIAYEGIKPAIEKEIQTLNLDRAKSRLARYKKATLALANTKETTSLVEVKDKEETLSKHDIVKVSPEAFRKAVADGDISACELLFQSGLNPNDDENAWIILEAIGEKNPIADELLEMASKSGFDVNKEVKPAPVMASAFLSRQRAKMEKWFASDGALNREKLIEISDVWKNENSFNLGAILALSNIEPNSDLEKYAEKYGLDMNQGVVMRNNLHSAYRDLFSAMINSLNNFIKKENDIYKQLLTLKNCKNLKKYPPMSFDNNLDKPLYSFLFNSQEIKSAVEISSEVEDSCKEAGGRQKANKIIDDYARLFHEMSGEFKEKVDNLKIKEVSQKLNEYKKATTAIAALGQ